VGRFWGGDGRGRKGRGGKGREEWGMYLSGSNILKFFSPSRKVVKMT